MSGLNLSEFFNNDDSDGHRLAEFLKKKRGGARPQLLYLNYESQRKSLHVQLEKLPDKSKDKSPDKKNVENVNVVNNQPENNNGKSVEEQLALIHGEKSASPTLPSSPPLPVASLSNEKQLDFSKRSSLRSDNFERPSSPVRLQNLERPISPSIALSPSKPSSPSRPLSPRLSAVRKSGGLISPGDRLRRLSLKRLTTKIHGGRRTLLKEFENTLADENFEPPLCSTPLSQPLAPPTSPTLNSSSGSPLERNYVEPTAGDNKLADTCCGHSDTIFKTLQLHDEGLKNYLDNFETTLKNIEQLAKEKEKKSTNGDTSLSKSQTLQNDTSTSKRTYTLTKGQSPGQVILTPDKSVAASQRPQTRLLTSHAEESLHQNKSLRFELRDQSPSKIMKTPQRSTNRSIISIGVKSPRNLYTSPQHLSQSLRQTGESPNRSRGRSQIMLEKSRTTSALQQIFPTHEAMEVEITETQEVPNAENCILIRSQSDSKMPLVIIPVNQTYNQVHTEPSSNNNEIKISKPKSAEIKSNTPTLHKTSDECKDMPEDNLKLTDILTDDDDDYTPKAASRPVNIDKNNSQAPLNLAPSATNLRTKRLRKRSLSRRRLQMERSQLLSTENENEPSIAHSANRRRIVKRKHIQLNRAPGTPLNGERFAIELKRMSNYEILDLRKRNSMGRVFAISGRKSSSLQEETNKKQLQLDNEIEMELLRRDLEKSVNNNNIQPDNVNTQEGIPEEFPPVPEEFRDNSQQEENQNLQSSFADENSIDRVSFKPETRRSSLKSKNKIKPMPESLKQYLEVPNIIKTKKKSHNSLMDLTKRSLYTLGNSDVEETAATSSAETHEIEQSTYTKTNKKSLPNKQSQSKAETSKNKNLGNEASPSKKKINSKLSLLYVPSPPPSETDQMPSLRVISPPPPLAISFRESQTQVDVPAAEGDIRNLDEPLPPPPEFDSDSGVSSNNLFTQLSPITQKHKEISSNNKIPANDDDVFKKPLPPSTPKKKKPGRKRKSKIDNVLLNDLHVSHDTSTGSSLRRSKRQVHQHIPLFQILYQEALNRRLQTMEKNEAKQKQRTKNISKATLGDNSTINSVKSINLEKSPTKSSSRAGKRKLPKVPEDESFLSSLQNDMEILNTKKQTQTLKISKVLRKNTKNDKHHKSIEEKLECSRINLTTPPPVDHFNNVFDHLRHTTTTLENHCLSDQQPPTDKQQLKELHQLEGGEISKVKKLSVRLKRVKSSNWKANNHLVNTNNQLVDSNPSSNYVSSSSVVSSQSNFELISWLKNITEAESMEHNDEIFKEMHISAASNLSFSTIQGVEYAFYDTVEQGSLGYLRFQPGQMKPKKRAKHYHLHFVTLVGQFRITANDKEKRVGPGDMVAIEKSVYYDIENLTNDIGILMVIKK